MLVAPPNRGCLEPRSPVVDISTFPSLAIPRHYHKLMENLCVYFSIISICIDPDPSLHIVAASCGIIFVPEMTSPRYSQIPI